MLSLELHDNLIWSTSARIRLRLRRTAIPGAATLCAENEVDAHAESYDTNMKYISLTVVARIVQRWLALAIRIVAPTS